MILCLTLLKYLLPGITLGFAAAVQPGPLSLYLISRTLQSGWKRTFPAVFTPLITDGPVALLCLGILVNLPPYFLKYIQVPGGIFILYLAFQAVKSWRKKETALPAQEASSRKTLINAAIVNILNPSAYLGWSLVIGPLFLKSWKEAPVDGVSLLGGFYITMILATIVILLLFDLARDRGAKIQRIMLGFSALFLAAFGMYQLYSGIFL